MEERIFIKEWIGVLESSDPLIEQWAKLSGIIYPFNDEWSDRLISLNPKAFDVYLAAHLRHLDHYVQKCSEGVQKKITEEEKGRFWKDGLENDILSLSGAIERAGAEIVKGEVKAFLEYLHRKKLAWSLAKEIEMKLPDTTRFSDFRSFRLHFSALEEDLKDWVMKKESAPSERSFKEELNKKFKKLNKEIEEKYKLWNPDEAQRNIGAIGLPENFHKEHQKERETYLYVLFKNRLASDFLSKMFSSSINNPQKKGAFIHEIVDTNFAEVLERWPNAKEKAEELKEQMFQDLTNFKIEDVKFGRGDTMEDLEKGIAFSKKRIKEFNYKPNKEFYSIKLAEYEAMFAFYQHLKLAFTDKEAKRTRLEKQLEEWKISPQAKAIQGRLKVISESLQKSTKAVQKSLEPVRRALRGFEESIPHLIKIFSDAEIGHKEAADFYRDWIGKAPIPQREFLDWFFGVKHRHKTLNEMLERPIVIKVGDIEEAGHWLVAQIKLQQNQRRAKEQKSIPQAFGPELVEVVREKDVLTMRQIAIFHRYLGKEINVGNRDQIASEYGFNAPTSGQKLYNAYNRLRSPTDRVGKHRYAERDIEKAISILNEKYLDNQDAISRAKDELKTAQANNR